MMFMTTTTFVALNARSKMFTLPDAAGALPGAGDQP